MYKNKNLKRQKKRQPGWSPMKGYGYWMCCVEPGSRSDLKSVGTCPRMCTWNLSRALS